MEVRGEDKQIEMRSTLGYNSPNRDSSSKLSSPTLSSAVGERIRDQIAQGNIFTSTQTQTQTQTLEHRHISFQPNREATHKPKRNSDQNPDPVSAPAASVVETTTTHIAGGSNFKTIAPPIREATVNAAGSSPARYRECLKNHAATTGGHVFDGCGEFMPSGEEGSPEALKCAACECHRSFHRKEIAGGSKYPPVRDTSRRNSSLQHYLPQPPAPPSLHQHHHHHHHPPHHQFSIHGLPTSPIPAGPFPPVMMAFGGSHGAAAESSSEDLNMFQSNYGGKPSSQHPLSSKKRFRTKFTSEQKDKMMEFAEKLGWRIQKHDEQEVQSFCSEVGVNRRVLKVWMHNNKQAMKKKEGEV